MICMTETITIRLKRPKAEIEARANPNVNAWMNRLIDQALGPRAVDWNEFFDRQARQAVKRRFKKIAATSDEVRRASR
jgi:hypothetical protein